MFRHFRILFLFRCVVTQEENAVKVVRHDNESIQLDSRITVGDLAPDSSDGATGRTENHPSIVDFSEEAGPISYAKRNEVSAGFGVVVAFEPDVLSNGTLG